MERKRILYAVDDGTGLIQVAQLFNSDAQQQTPQPVPSFAVGKSVVVRGSLSRYGRSPVEVKVVEMQQSSNPNDEALHWCTAVELARSTYRQPLAYDAPLALAVSKWKESKNRKRGGGHSKQGARLW